MQSKASISVIIPTYNRACDLMKAVESVLAQTYPVSEILVCDDGSTDQSQELILSLNNPIIKWIVCGKNGGPAIPRNIGVNQSTSNWVAFLDSDDTWRPNKIKAQLQAMSELNIQASCTNANRIRNNVNEGPYLDYNKQNIRLYDLMKQNSVICSTVLIKKKILLDTSLFPEDKKFTAVEDYSLWLRISTQTPILYINETLVDYFDNFETSLRAEQTTDNWAIFEIIFTDFKRWVKTKRITLGLKDKKELKLLFKRIKRKGVPTQWQEFIRKLNYKLNFSYK